MNFIPKMNPQKLVEGYQQIVTTIYDPAAFYDRVYKFFKEFKPIKRRRSRTLPSRLPQSPVAGDVLPGHPGERAAPLLEASVQDHLPLPAPPAGCGELLHQGLPLPEDVRADGASAVREATRPISVSSIDTGNLQVLVQTGALAPHAAHPYYPVIH